MEKNEKDKRLNIGVGTKTTSLKPVAVDVVDVKIEPAESKDNKYIGEKVVLICKHPDRQENIELSQAKYERGKVIETSGLWFKQDVDGKIPKDSALAALLKSANVSVIGDLIGKKLQTATGDRGFLLLKAY